MSEALPNREHRQASQREMGWLSMVQSKRGTKLKRTVIHNAKPLEVLQ